MDRYSRTKIIDRWTRLAAIAWVATFALSFAWQWNDARHDALGFAVAEARAVFNRDLVVHRWASRHGGVLVAARPGAPGLTEVVNPSEFIRETHAMSLDKDGTTARIVSLTPRISQNRPDPWEAAALRRFSSSNDEYETYGVARENGHAVLRYIQPMTVGPSCIQCHSDEHLRVGGRHGALSVTLPMATFDRAMRKRVATAALFHALFGGVGLAGIIWTSRRFRRHARIQEESERRFRLFYENAPIAYQALDATGRILEVNGAWLKMFGYLRSEVIGCPLPSLVDPIQLEALAEWLKTCRGSGTMGYVELNLRTKVGVAIAVSLQSCAWQGFGESAGEIHSVVRRRQAGDPGPGHDGPASQGA